MAAVGSVFLPNLLTPWDLWHPSPVVALTVAWEPGPRIEFEPRKNAIMFEVTFTAENTGKASEAVLATRGVLESRRGSLLHFVSSDVECIHNSGCPFSSCLGAPVPVTCRLRQQLGAATTQKLTAPGPLVLKLTVQGRADARYDARYCISATDGFWGAIYSRVGRLKRAQS